MERIRAERADLASQRAVLEQRDAELAVAERVLAELEGNDKSKASDRPQELSLSPAPNTRREKVIFALSGEKIWMTSAEINQAIGRRHGAEIKSTSFYPMVSLLTKERVIIRRGDKLALRSRLGEGQAVND